LSFAGPNSRAVKGCAARLAALRMPNVTTTDDPSIPT
jgi:hypothetical protein